MPVAEGLNRSDKCTAGTLDNITLHGAKPSVGIVVVGELVARVVGLAVVVDDCSRSVGQCRGLRGLQGSHVAPAAAAVSDAGAESGLTGAREAFVCDAPAPNGPGCI